jgi:hypothetical protein
MENASRSAVEEPTGIVSRGQVRSVIQSTLSNSPHLFTCYPEAPTLKLRERKADEDCSIQQQLLTALKHSSPTRREIAGVIRDRKSRPALLHHGPYRRGKLPAGNARQNLTAND